MTNMPGQSCRAVRVSADEAEDWTCYELGTPVGDRGGTAQVYRINANSTPPLLAKIYHSDSILARIAKEPAYAQRLMYLGLARADLNRALPFCAWPRRIIFSEREPHESKVAASIIGLTVAELATHQLLADGLRDEASRLRMTHAHGIHLAISLADQLHRLNSHPWRFVFGDLSPSNLFVDYSFSSVHFIDMDAIGFAPPGVGVVFDRPGPPRLSFAGLLQEC